MVDASERLQVLLTQEERIYKTSDYLTRLQTPNYDDCRSMFTPTSSPSSPKKRKSLDGGIMDGEDQEESTERLCHSAAAAATDCEGSEGSATSQINKHWREKICEWAYQVVDHFDLNREVVSIAMNHLDRFLGAFSGTVDKNLFQLLAMTCLYLSIKLNEYKHLLIQGSTSSMDTILQLSRGFFSLEKMEKMEYEVLQLLRWHVHPPTPQLFVKHFLFFLSVSEPEVHDLAQFMVELSVMDYYFVSYKQSEVAIASLLNAMERLVPQSSIEICLPFQSQFLDIHSSRVQDCRDRLALIYAQANDQVATGDRIESTPLKDPEPAAIQHRTTSPVSVMAAPQPCQTEFSSKISHHHYSPPPTSMETEYSDDEEWDLGDEEEDSDL